MSMPDPGPAMHVSAVDYAVSFGPLADAAHPVTFASAGLTSFTFTFDTGETEDPPGSWTIEWDQSWFDQAAAEARIAGWLDGSCEGIAAVLGLAQADVQAIVTVRRIWTYNLNSYTIIPGVTSGTQTMTWVDVMPYPAGTATAGPAAASAAAALPAVTGMP
jgi:hypothetical protein